MIDFCGLLQKQKQRKITEERCIKRFLCFLRKQREYAAIHSARAAGYYIAIQVA
jgi:hypothetical protein